MCAIHDTFNACYIDTKHSCVINKDLFNSFNELIKLFINSWNKQEVEKENKRKESENLYKIK